ncbi:MAG: hypothetical protein WD557_07795 [Dehalococcoidia bacterium]
MATMVRDLEYQGTDAGAGPRGARAEFFHFAQWAILGAAAGGLAGLTVGGVGGRLAMLLLRLTSSDAVNGVESDDGFEIGQFTLAGTFSLLIATMLFGGVVGLFIVLARAFMPWQWVTWAWGLVGAVVGGSLIVHDGGVDFELLEPAWLAVALFVALPAVGVLAMAWLARWFETWWWERRRRMAVVSLAALPMVVFFPIVIIVAVVAAAWTWASRSPAVRSLPSHRGMQILATCVFGTVIAVGGYALVLDVQSVL